MAGAKKLLERMRRTKHGWTPSDVEKVYLDAGFEKREGAGHTIYTHPEFRSVWATVARHGELAPGYIEALLERLSKIQGLREQAAQGAEATD